MRGATGRPTGQTRDQRAIATLSRIANRAPEVMVRSTGKQSDAAHLTANMAYISRIERDEKSREGVELVDLDGKVITTPDEIKQLAREWEAHEQKCNDHRKGAVSRSWVFSMPAGTDPEKVRIAAHGVPQVRGEQLPA